MHSPHFSTLLGARDDGPSWFCLFCLCCAVSTKRSPKKSMKHKRLFPVLECLVSRKNPDINVGRGLTKFFGWHDSLLLTGITIPFFPVVLLGPSQENPFGLDPCFSLFYSLNLRNSLPSWTKFCNHECKLLLSRSPKLKSHRTRLSP